ncbi:MAG: hypothetical protein IPK64_13370 [bacterium]|nr:hypothetical protein [bacterium]
MARALKPSIALFVCSILLTAGSSAFAQGNPDFNRRVVSFELYPPDAVGSTWSSRAVLSVTGFTPAAAGTDAGLVLQFLVDGVVVGEQILAAIVQGAGNCNCTSGCEPGYCDDSEFGCWCGVVVTPNLHTYTNKSLTPGSTVSVQIVAAAGSAAEQHVDDDSASLLVDDAVSTSLSTWSSLKGAYR